MLIVADSGSTKTTWILQGDEGQFIEINTIGLNPNHSKSEEIAGIIRESIALHTPNTAEIQLFFYGSGCSGPATNGIIRAALETALPGAEIFIGSDLLGAARGLLGKRPGIACILGTGSNSGLYDGRDIIENTPPLGFILGDEGSGTFLGKLILGDLLKGVMPGDLARNFREEYDIDTEKIIEKVYRGEFPARYVSGFVSFIHKNIRHDYLRKVVESSFQLFIDRNIVLYKDYKDVPLCFTGSVAWLFREQLEGVLANNNLVMSELIRNPTERIYRYHNTPNTKGL